ncbi:unnamed protein product [Moneuplotes crassus]|uniref:Transmembrane protein n=1 Tax=Euplotes crassus TaxID=5936 RepID=A0AAD1XZM7_EUPCR|nr:unnamed protein product [Moneuplotes crassus]
MFVSQFVNMVFGTIGLISWYEGIKEDCTGENLGYLFMNFQITGWEGLDYLCMIIVLFGYLEDEYVRWRFLQCFTVCLFCIIGSVWGTIDMIVHPDQCNPGLMILMWLIMTIEAIHTFVSKIRNIRKFQKYAEGDDVVDRVDPESIQD